jgi:acetoin utilization deacetylase AcuC-like enzyme
MKRNVFLGIVLILSVTAYTDFACLTLAGAEAFEKPRQAIWYHTGYPGGVAGPPSGMSALTGPTKMPAVFEAIRRQALVAPERLHTDSVEVRNRAPAAPPIDLESLRAVHTDRYLKAVLTGEPAHLALSQGLPAWSRDVARGWLLNSGGLAAAAEAAVRERTITANLGHGYHHATATQGMGFCTINGLLVAARKLIRAGKAGRIMIVDLDHHEGNGTGEGVIGDPRIWNVSIYGSYMGGPGSAANNRVFEVHHRAFTKPAERDENYLAAIASVLPGLIRRQSPDLVMYQAGMDPFDGGGISAEALAVRDAYVFALCRTMGIPVAWVLAGGYADLETLVRLHTGTARGASEVLDRVRPGGRIEHRPGDPYRWSVRGEAAVFSNWGAAGGDAARMTPRPSLTEAEVRERAAARIRAFREECLADEEMRAAYDGIRTQSP